MSAQHPPKRLKSSSGASVGANHRAGSSSPAASLQAYQPPAPIASGARAGRPSASIARPSNGRGPLRLTVKAPPSKLRQATSGSQLETSGNASNPYSEQTSESDATPRPPVRRARAARNVRTVIETETDDDDEDQEEEEEDQDQDIDDDEDEDEDEEDEDEDEEEQDEDAEGEVDPDLSMNGDSEEDAEGEDEEMIDVAHPAPPVIKQSTNRQGQPNVTVTAPPEGPLKSVEAKEMEEEDDDEELSDLESDENEAEEDEEEEDSGDEDMDASRSATPDLSKLTRRQRGYFEENNLELMALSNEAQKKKHLTAEEHAMRRAEMARRRKNLSEKRNEEEKMDTINKLLKKPAPKRRTRQEILAAQQADAMGTPGAEDGEEEKPDAVFVRWNHSKDGSRIGVPDEWIGAPVGEVFRQGWNGRSTGGGPRMMVEEVS